MNSLFCCHTCAQEPNYILENESHAIFVGRGVDETIFWWTSDQSRRRRSYHSARNIITFMYAVRSGCFAVFLVVSRNRWCHSSFFSVRLRISGWILIEFMSIICFHTIYRFAAKPESAEQQRRSNRSSDGSQVHIMCAHHIAAQPARAIVSTDARVSFAELVKAGDQIAKRSRCVPNWNVLRSAYQTVGD